MKQSTHNRNLPCCQSTETCFHVSSIKNNTWLFIYSHSHALTLAYSRTHSRPHSQTNLLTHNHSCTCCAGTSQNKGCLWQVSWSPWEYHSYITNGILANWVYHHMWTFHRLVTISNLWHPVYMRQEGATFESVLNITCAGDCNSHANDN